MSEEMHNKIEQVTFRAQLEQVAEECGELTQACMKTIRAFGNGNPCDISKDQAIDNLVEEMADLSIAIGYLIRKVASYGYFEGDENQIFDLINKIGVEKAVRWQTRLEAEEAKDEQVDG